MLRKLLTGTWDLYYVPTVTLYSTYHHHNPVTVPGPQCCDHLLGGGALYTLYTLYSVQCVQWSAACAVQGDTGQLRCRCAIVQSQYSVFSARTAAQ